MTKRSLKPTGALPDLRNMAALQTLSERGDHELLERFVEAGDEAAFAALVERHGPMVLGVCRRALPSYHNAEDACQTTFLVMARKAALLRKNASLGAWLHGVACRVVASLKRENLRRTARERGIDIPILKDPATEVTWRELQAILDEELRQLPERNRAPLILCYLECMTRDEAALQLGISSSTLHGRLERGRELLRERLTKRGLTIAAVMSAVALVESVAQAGLAPTFAHSTYKAAMSFGAGQPLMEVVTPTQVVTLGTEISNSMLLTKLKLGKTAVMRVLKGRRSTLAFGLVIAAVLAVILTWMVISPRRGAIDGVWTSTAPYLGTEPGSVGLLIKADGHVQAKAGPVSPFWWAAGTYDLHLHGHTIEVSAEGRPIGQIHVRLRQGGKELRLLDPVTSMEVLRLRKHGG